MRVIKYYDRINRKNIDLEVTDVVAKFLASSDKKIQRKQNDYDYFTVSVDNVVYYGGCEDEDITYNEIIPEPEEVTMNCITCDERLAFYNVVWKVVAKLDKEKYDLIWDIFVEKKSQREIAKDLGKDEELISQLKDTAFNDLIYHFNFDEDFNKSEYYEKYLIDAIKDWNRITKQLTAEDIGQYIMNDVYDFTKTLTQTLKKSTILDKDIKDKDKISKTNRIVKQTTEKLNADKEKNKQLNIPKNIFTKENMIKIMEQLNKFLK